MSKCYFEGIYRNSQIWGKYSSNENIEKAIVKYARKAFKHYNMTADVWVEPVYFDDSYIMRTSTFFHEAGVALYPRYTHLPRALNDLDSKDYARVYHASVLVDIEVAKSRGVKPLYCKISGVRFPIKNGIKEAYSGIEFVESFE